MGKTLVIFDVDGTLVFSNRIDSQCFAKTYEAIYSRPFPTIDWHKYPHVTDHTIFSSVIQEQFQRVVTLEETDHFQDRFVALLEKSREKKPADFQMVPFARQIVLDLLLHPDYVVGIGTGGWKRPARLKLSHVDIPVTEIILSAADGKATREAILEEVIAGARSIHGSFRKIVYIGDAVWDVQTTRNLSIDFVGIRRHGDFHVLEQVGATRVLKDFSDRHGFFHAIENSTPPTVPN